VPKVIVSPRNPAGPVELEIPVDPALLAAGDHNGSTFYQHQRFLRAATGMQQPDVSFEDGWWAAAIGQAAQQSALTGHAVSLRDFDCSP
jgi:predicted dehydrogenase